MKRIIFFLLTIFTSVAIHPAVGFLFLIWGAFSTHWFFEGVFAFSLLELLFAPVPTNFIFAFGWLPILLLLIVGIEFVKTRLILTS